LDERYNIRYIPAFVFVDEEGNEVDRIVGYLPPDEYLAEMTRIRNGIDTYPHLLSQWDERPEDPEVLFKLATKVEEMSGLSGAMGYWEILFGLENATSHQHGLANFKLAVYHANEAGDPEALVTLLDNEKDIDILKEAHYALRRFYQKAADTTAEAESYRRYIDFMFGAGKETASLLNGYAWRMTELNLQLPNALERIDQAIQLLDEETTDLDRAQILDTKAEVLWKLGEVEQAIEVMEECIRLVPDESYFQEQKTKFEGTSS